MISYSHIMSLPSDSIQSSSSVSVSAQKSKRYRERRKQGLTSHHLATKDEQTRLLSLPYQTLTDQEKSRVRYY